MTDGLEDEIERVRRLAADVWLAMTPQQADQIQGVLSRLDRQQILSDPILLNASIMSRHLTTRAGSEREEYGLVASSAGVSEYCAKAVQTTSSIDDLIGYGRILIVGVRAAGDLARAEEIGAFVERRVAALRNGAEVGPGIWIRPGQLALHRGITQTLMGEFATAMTSYRRAWTKRGEPPRLHFAGAEAAGNSAMLAAVEGHFEVAETWLGRLGQYQDREGWASHMTYLGEYIARGILAADALDLPAARRAAELAGPATQPVELWPFLAVQETAVELVLGNPQRAYAALRAAAFTHDHDVSHSAICGGILLRALLDCLVALGEGNRVLAAAEESGLVRALVPMARVHLLSGHPEEALRLADSAARRGDLPVRDLRELLLLRAVALLRCGDEDRAGEAFGSFSRLDDRFCAAMRARVPSQEYARLCELCGPAPPAPGDPMNRSAPIRMEVVHLTRTELLVLRELTTGQTLAKVAGTTFTSVNTIKTHVRSIYRKLGVGSRAEAIARARELGLLK